MSVDEVQERTRSEIVGLASTSLPGLRDDAQTVETITPIRSTPPRRRPAELLVERAREGLAWTRLRGLARPDPRPESFSRLLVRRFALCVLVPTALLAVYLFVFAADQYISEARFAVRGNVEPMENIALGEYTSLIHKHNSQDGYIVRDYIVSSTMVADLEKSINLSAMFSRSEADFWTRLWTPKPLEDLTRYWRDHVDARIDAISGVVMVSVRAFTPEDALTIVREIVKRAETLVNDISHKAKADMLVQSQVDATAAQDRLRKAHLGLQEFRNRWGIVDPIKAAEATMTTMVALRKDKLKAESDLQVLRGSGLDEKSRSIQTLVATVAANDQQLKVLQDQLTTEGMTGHGSPTITNALLEYEGLVIERTIAEKLNESARTLLDRARVEAGKQHIFLSTFVPPTLPTSSLYPLRWRDLVLGLFCFVVLWSAGSLLISGVKDQRL